MSIYEEIASILAEGPRRRRGRGLDMSKCTLMSADHWSPEDIYGEDPEAVVAMLDELEALDHRQLVRA